MNPLRGAIAALAAAIMLVSGPGCGDALASAAEARKLEVTIATAKGPHLFTAEVADTGSQQERGFMFRTNIGADDAMIFLYPERYGAPHETRFWMKNTPSSLDILFIRPDGTIAKIAANLEPYSEESVTSGEPVSAVLEIRGGRSAELGIALGDKVSWGKKRG